MKHFKDFITQTAIISATGSFFVPMSKYLLYIFIAAVAFVSCRKDELFKGSDAKLDFSTDTIFFDTVFTTVGSITERVKIYNPYNKTVEISRVWLKNGQASNFKLNVDGIPGKEVEEVRIGPSDSIFVFVEVTVDPNGGNTPMVIEDQMLVETNGNVQHVDLVAWGQDAYFFPSSRFRFDQPVSLLTDKPNVFYGYSVVDTGTTLIIPCGASVYFHANSGLYVGHEASLKVLGCVDDPVIMQGDRLEDYFKEVPGQWGQLIGGIYLSSTSRDNEIRNAIIKNGTAGVIADSNTNENPTLVLENTQILNMSYIGLLGRTARIEGRNSVVANCGDHAVALAYGGDYHFTHCTFANYWSGNPRSKAVLLLNNYFEVEKVTYARDLNVLIENSIVHGTLDEEFELDKASGAAFDFVFDHVILKVDEEDISDPAKYKEIIQNPAGSLFPDIKKGDYSLIEGAPAINKGKTTAVTTDITGAMRDAQPDLGAYEFIP